MRGAGTWETAIQTSYSDTIYGKIVQDATCLYINSSQGKISLGANVGIGTASPGYTLTVAGTAWVTSGAWSGSDRRWKKDIIFLRKSLEKVIQLQGVNYYWRDTEFPAQHFSKDKQIGLIAQDTEKIIPEIVITDQDGYKGISYEKLVPVLIEAIKELKIEKDAEIASKNSEIKELKAEKDTEIKEIKIDYNRLKKEIVEIKRLLAK